MAGAWPVHRGPPGWAGGLDPDRPIAYVLSHPARMAQIDLARRAGVSRDQVALIERGQAADVRRDLDRTGGGGPRRSIDVRLRWHGERLDRLLDAATRHVAAGRRAPATMRLGRGCRGVVSICGERGSIDVLAWHEPTGTLLVIEVKSVVRGQAGAPPWPGPEGAAGCGDRLARGWAARGPLDGLVVLAEAPTSRGRVAAPVATVLDGSARPRVGVRGDGSPPGGPVAGLLFLPIRQPGARRSGDATRVSRRRGSEARIRLQSRRPLTRMRRGHGDATGGIITVPAIGRSVHGSGPARARVANGEFVVPGPMRARPDAPSRRD